ncbi:MAG: AAA family ATPase [Nitrospiraceae bacterium]|nr:AAA family ATPase [Nitrospiraceae bacterium]|tara:strand:- start:6415 stop:7239 length:825 start_codon:yes stop_codon:yes gene_type:complete
MTVSSGTAHSAITSYSLDKEPYYAEVGKEVELFTTAAKLRMPILLKGPTGCGKSRFVQSMAYRLERPLVTVACHEDLTASDLVGRYLLKDDETVWMDGPLSLAVKHGAICYLDEIVEARKDTTVLIHPLTDDRRILPVEKRGETLKAADNFMLVMSYNPGYQSAIKDLKQSTRQRFLAVEFDYPPRDLECQIIIHETGIDPIMAASVVKLGEKVRNLKHHGLDEGVSTRLLIYAASLIHQGISPQQACDAAIVRPMSDDAETQRGLHDLIATIF